MTFSLYLYDGSGNGARTVVTTGIELDPGAVVAMNRALVATLYRWLPDKERTGP